MSGNRMIIKNEDTNKFYSLAENTLIHLPNSSNENIILHGIEQGEEVRLDTPFVKHNFVSEDYIGDNSGKIFMQEVGKINNLKIKEVIHDVIVPSVSWHILNMTSNTTPAPYVASASSQYSSYQVYKLFSTLENNTENRWRSSDGDISNAYIDIDFGTTVDIDRVKITSVNYSTTINGTPQDYEVMGSLNGVEFYSIKTFTFENWKINESNISTFQKEKVRFARLRVSRAQGSVNYLNLGKITYGYSEVN